MNNRQQSRHSAPSHAQSGQSANTSRIRDLEGKKHFLWQQQERLFERHAELVARYAAADTAQASILPSARTKLARQRPLVMAQALLGGLVGLQNMYSTRNYQQSIQNFDRVELHVEMELAQIGTALVACEGEIDRLDRAIAELEVEIYLLHQGRQYLPY